MNLNEYLNTNRISNKKKKPTHLNRRLFCNDGFSVSIQCNRYTYCSPQEEFVDVINYDSFELGFPNQYDELIIEYAEDKENSTETVYQYVPRNIVEQLIAKHGGIKQ